MASKHPAGKARQLQLRISLLDTIPLVWRSIVVPEAITLPALHTAIQAAMGWHDCHPHEFRTAKGSYGNVPRGADFVDDIKTERGVRFLGALGPARSCEYVYDFGDDWQHLVQIEDVPASTEESAKEVRCIAGANACPPEDVGGVLGYEQFLWVMAHPSHENHAESREWIGGAFDPRAFDLEAANRRLGRSGAAWRRA